MKYDWCFLALEPSEPTYSRVCEWKSQAMELVGEQTYFSEPPHLTLYVAAFADCEAGVEHLASLAGESSLPPLRFNTWEVFYHDKLTGGHTLVWRPDIEARQTLRELQGQLVPELAGLREADVTALRYQPLERFAPEEQSNIAAHGVPYFGHNWEPHMTVGSVSPADWPRLWEMFRQESCDELVRFDSLGLFRVADAKLLRRIALSV